MWAKQQDIREIVDGIRSSGLTINKAEDVKLAYEAKHNKAVSLDQVKYVMKALLNMKYSKIVRHNIHANADRCIYAR